MTATDRTTLQLLYDFIDNAFTEDECNPTSTLMVKRRQLRLYARSFVCKRLAAEDYAAVLDAIRGRW